jgi:hypothetical protein
LEDWKDGSLVVGVLLPSFEPKAPCGQASILPSFLEITPAEIVEIK